MSQALLGYTAFRLGFVLLSMACAALLWKRPRPRLAVAWVLASQLAAWLAYTIPLARPYGMAEGTDRAFNVGMAACVANGHSPLQHTQIGCRSPEPFWNAVVGALSFARPEWTAAVYGLLSPLAILAVGLSLYVGLRFRNGATAEDAWERFLIVFSVLNLTSMSLHRPTLTVFYTANFLLKPNHAVGFALIALAVGARFRPGRRWVSLSFILGLLAWVFLPHWFYLALGLVLSAWLAPASEKKWRPLLMALAVSSLIAAPLMAHLLRAYNPIQRNPSAEHMWNDPGGLSLAMPTVSTVELGPLFVLGLLGLWILRRRGSSRDRTMLGIILAVWCLWGASIPAALLGFAPEPDDLHYYLRFVMGLATGTALAFLARHGERALRLRNGQGHLAAFVLCLPMSFPSYWFPPAMDNYHPANSQPIGRRVVAYTKWIRENTPRTAVFLAGQDAATWIPALAGRPVLLAEAGKLVPRDLQARRHAERVLLTSEDAGFVRMIARRFGVTHVAIDRDLLERYGARRCSDLAHAPAYRYLFSNARACVLEIDFGDQPPAAQ
ncbi:MAG: hypothetical protein JXO72_07495 [Vicinamibacteria bacterium]|nr:hypothetical protein [Vicinamibacteria bacterium]